MARIPKFILIGVALVGCVLFIALLSAYVYLQSSASRAQLEAVLERSAGMPVKIGSVSVGLPASVKVTGATVPQVDPERSGNFIEIGEFAAELNPLALIGRRLEIEQIQVRSPRVAWYQDKKGRWRLPERPRDEKIETPTRVPGKPGTGEGARPSETAEEFREEKGKGMRFALQDLGITKGAFAFYDKKGAPIFVFEGVEAHAPTASAEEVAGEMSCSSLTAVEHFKFIGSRSDFSYRSGDVRITGIGAVLAGGRIGGDFRMQTALEDSPFEAGFKFDGVELGRLVADAGWSEQVELSGSVDGYFAAKGGGRDLEEMEGGGQILCENARIKSFGFLMALAQAFGIRELADLNVKRAQADFRVSDKKIWIDYLVLDGGAIELGCWGKVKMNGKLDLKARLKIGDTLLAQIPAGLKTNFVPADGGGGAIEFDIGGSIEKPKSDIVERLLGKKIEEQAVNLIKNLLGAPGEKEGDAPRPGH